METIDCTCPAIGQPWFSHARNCPIRTGVPSNCQHGTLKSECWSCRTPGGKR